MEFPPSREDDPGIAAGAVLEAIGLRKSFGRVSALADVRISVGEGEFVALLGPNGAGKSTLMQLLTGLFSPDSGRISILGHELRRNPVLALAHIGVVFQQPTLDLELSVVANLRFHAELHGLPDRITRQRIAQGLERVGLSDRRNAPTRELSGGNRRRIELVRALLHAPKLLLMDEPTVGLDPASRRDLHEHILKLKAEERLGVLWATHLVDEAEGADRIVVLHQGTVLFDGAPKALAAREGVDTIAAAFLKMTGSNPAREPAS